MSIAKVTLDGVSQLDLTGVTVEANNLLTGVTAHNAAGESITGTAKQNNQDSYLQNVSFPTTYTNNQITAIGKRAFSNTSVTVVNAPNATSIGDEAFRDTSIVTVNAPNVLTIGDNAFYNLKTFTAVNFPNVTSIGNETFKDYNAGSVITSISTPKLQTVGNSAFYKTKITTICLPEIRSINQQAFYECSQLTTIDLGSNLTIIGASCFYLCSALTTIILRQNTQIVTTSYNILNNTAADSGGTGITIYIPEVLYNHLGDNSSLDYKAATNWSIYDGYGTITWAKIQGSYYETHYGDGTLIPT